MFSSSNHPVFNKPMAEAHNQQRAGWVRTLNPPPRAYSKSFSSSRPSSSAFQTGALISILTNRLKTDHGHSPGRAAYCCFPKMVWMASRSCSPLINQTVMNLICATFCDLNPTLWPNPCPRGPEGMTGLRNLAPLKKLNPPFHHTVETAI